MVQPTGNSRSSSDRTANFSRRPNISTCSLVDSCNPRAAGCDLLQEMGQAVGKGADDPDLSVRWHLRNGRTVLTQPPD